MASVDKLRRRWPVVLGVMIVAAVGINLLDTSYNSLQTASDAAAFHHTLTSEARALGATGCDIVFAVSYGLLGLIALRALNVPTRLARPAAVLVVAASLFDELENLALVRNIVAQRTLTDGWITVMRAPGTLKWVGSPVFFALLIALAWRATHPPRTRQPRTPA